ncbi:uncharacterized protein PAC_18094 [Phialocephala subalpina]|uniref:Ariadne-2 protein n=1 Tax=Phialocephala subalpina TaxID=576137 RepID=A0A1L7XT76_9HELO|nr:uncharacterized protein PAC_18094 [Phialocephala subalpina]
MAPCKFYTQGRCLFGASCKNSHEATDPSNQLKLFEKTEPTFHPSTIPSTPLEGGPLVVCKFFAWGSCKYGAACRYLHVEPKSDAAKLQIANLPMHVKNVSYQPKDSSLSWRPEAPVFEPQAQTTVKISLSQNDEDPVVPANLDKKPISTDLCGENEVSREINGAITTFKDGAEVAQIQLLSDFSTVQIEGLDPNSNVLKVSEILSRLGFTVSESNIVVRNLGEQSCVAEVKVENPNFAKIVNQNLRRQHEDGVLINLSIKPIVRAATAGASGNRLQVSTVACTWYQASRVAWLPYSSRKKAQDAKSALEMQKVRHRTLDCSIQQNHGTFRNPRITWTLQVSNLHMSTSDRDLLGLLSGNVRPNGITLGRPSYSCSEAKSAEVVEALLREVGGLESFQHSAIEGSSKMKAMAHFSEREKAAEAVRRLHDTKVPELGDTKIFIAHVISVKYNVLNGIIKAMQSEIDKLRDISWKESHVQLRTYPQTDLRKPFTTLRVSGENLKSVAKAKAALEKLLAGTKVVSKDSSAWDPYLLELGTLVFLNELSNRYGLYIHQDARNSQLVIYSTSPASLDEVERILAERISTMQKTAHSVILSPELLKNAMQGGMQRLKARFGNAAKLNVSASPKTITIIGSKTDLEEARALLLQEIEIITTMEASEKEQDCVVCWCEASEPLITACGHTYCTDCFSNQTASDTAIPMRCFGDESKCKHIFNIQELKTMLSPTKLEELLQTSFNSYIRHHPSQFRYCPTPDCPQIYRTSTQGDAFLCSTCLTPVCTSCNVISHDGMSCAEFKDLSSEDAKAFQRYKKEHDVRDCPNCKVGIQKNKGCNHMECTNCHAHICWVCMKVFGSGPDCYGHMRKAHGSFV